MEPDEWVSIQAQTVDNFSMDRVEFFLDDELLTYDTVSPYNQRWTIVMTTTLEQDAELRKLFTENVPVEEWPVDQLPIDQTPVDETAGDDPPDEDRAKEDLIIKVTTSITVPHTIYVEAVDAAGNRTKSEEVRIYVIHEQEEEEDTAEALWYTDPGSWRALVRRDEEPVTQT